MERRIIIPTKPGQPAAEMSKREGMDFDAACKILEIPMLETDSRLPTIVSMDQEVGIEVLRLMTAAYRAGRLEAS